MVTQPTIATGIITAEYALKPMPAWSAKMRFIGLEMTRGATPAEANPPPANGTRHLG